jgi:penicillin-binding protein 1A
MVVTVLNQNGKVLFETKFDQAGNGAPRVIDARNAFIMTSMMQDVIRHGTATRALSLGRNDIAGKTGTTNDHFDAWFTGYSPKQVAVTWIGYDKPKSLGRSETGGTSALPIWIKYMATALRGQPDEYSPVPGGVSAIRIDPTTGVREDGDEGVYEYFYHENPPPEAESFFSDLFGDSEGATEPTLNQPQQVLQPDVVISPLVPNKIPPNQAGPNQPNKANKPEQQNAAGKLLNPN